MLPSGATLDYSIMSVNGKEIGILALAALEIVTN